MLWWRGDLSRSRLRLDPAVERGVAKRPPEGTEPVGVVKELALVLGLEIPKVSKSK
jgi:hypothetical protein